MISFSAESVRVARLAIIAALVYDLFFCRNCRDYKTGDCYGYYL